MAEHKGFEYYVYISSLHSFLYNNILKRVMLTYI